jgi:hypothetical protein
MTLSLSLPGAGADEDWRVAFDEACAQSNEAMALSVKELKVLIEKCDRIQSAIGTQDETVRKVFLKRLQMCRNLYVFVLETKVKEQQRK